jgi:hypothetical protein
MSAIAHVNSSRAKTNQVQLPDVTGLTVAVESPAKGQPYQPYEDNGQGREDDEGHGLHLLTYFPSLIQCLFFSSFATSHEPPSKEDCSSRCRESHLQETHEGA